MVGNFQSELMRLNARHQGLNSDTWFIMICKDFLLLAWGVHYGRNFIFLGELISSCWCSILLYYMDLGPSYFKDHLFGYSDKMPSQPSLKWQSLYRQDSICIYWDEPWPLAPPNRFLVPHRYHKLTSTSWHLNKMVDILQTTFSNAFSWKESFIFSLKFHMFLRVLLTIVIIISGKLFEPMMTKFCDIKWHH